MTCILPRWEWRTFRTTFGDAEARIREHATHLTTSRETYVISDATDANTKIRDMQLDIKALMETGREGLERWRPVVRETFPISQAVAKEACRRWSIPTPVFRRDTYTADEFLDEIVAHQPGLHAIHVREQRSGFTISDCLVEIAEVTFNGAPLRTIGVEMPDAARVMETLRSLGLDRFENVSYVKALRRFLHSKAPVTL